MGYGAALVSSLHKSRGTSTLRPRGSGGGDEDATRGRNSPALTISDTSMSLSLPGETSFSNASAQNAKSVSNILLSAASMSSLSLELATEGSGNSQGSSSGTKYSGDAAKGLKGGVKRSLVPTCGVLAL